MTSQRMALSLAGANVGRGQRLREPIDASATDWMRDAKCAKACLKRDCDEDHAHAEDWFPDGRHGRPGVDTEPNEISAPMRARRLCVGCPVDFTTCATYAISNGLDHGVYGGLTPAQRSRYALSLTIAQQDAS